MQRLQSVTMFYVADNTRLKKRRKNRCLKYTGVKDSSGGCTRFFGRIPFLKFHTITGRHLLSKHAVQDCRNLRGSSRSNQLNRRLQERCRCHDRRFNFCSQSASQTAFHVPLHLLRLRVQVQSQIHGSSIVLLWNSTWTPTNNHLPWTHTSNIRGHVSLPFKWSQWLRHKIQNWSNLSTSEAPTFK